MSDYISQQQHNADVATLRAEVQSVIGVAVSTAITASEGRYQELKKDLTDTIKEGFSELKHRVDRVDDRVDTVEHTISAMKRDIYGDGDSDTDSLRYKTELILRTINQHEASITRWQSFERMAGQVIQTIFSLPVLRFLGMIVKWLLPGSAIVAWLVWLIEQISHFM